MNKLIRNAAAILTAGIVAATGLSTTGFAASEEYTASYTAAYAATVAKPSYSVKGAKGYRYIKLSTATSGATIYYTTNGKTPTTKSRKYKSGTLLKISKNVQIKAIAVKGSSKSAVMTKTFKVGTVLGDVTGDGKINTNDYNRLKNYINGKTSYICKDNADVNGSGTITSKDLSLLKQYINGDIKKFPTSDDEEVTASLSVTPKITVYKTYGGKKIELTCSDKNATLYYTINGKTPSKSTLKYTGKFVVDDDTTIKCVAYKSGKYSKVVTREVEVDQCKSVETDTSTTQTYKDSVKVRLSCATPDSKIYYTLDGTDPKKYGTLYKDYIELTKDTTIRAYSRAKGYADSAVNTFTYKVESTLFYIVGTVWDDTPNSTSVPDGSRQSGETGINGITVRLINASTNEIVATTTTSTINGMVGAYKFENIKKGPGYKVVFVMNGQKYRPLSNVVTGGNQAIIESAPNYTIKSDGTYDNNNRVSSTNYYDAAVTDSRFEVTAKTPATYYSSADNVCLALNTKVYGEMKLDFSPVQVKSDGVTTALKNTNGQKVKTGDVITYQLTLSNNSTTQVLKDAVIRLYLDKDVELNQSSVSGFKISSTSYANGYAIYELYGFLGSGISKGDSVKLTVPVTVSSTDDNASIINYAEVISYNYSGSCFDKYSIPGNMRLGSISENDEARTVEITVEKNSKEETNKTIDSFASNLEVQVNDIAEYMIVVGNGTNGVNDVIISISEKAPFEYSTSSRVVGNNTYITITVFGKEEGGGKITARLVEDLTKSVTTNITVKSASSEGDSTGSW